MILDHRGAPMQVMDRAAPKFSAWDAGQTGRRLHAIPTASRAINTMVRTYGRAVLARSRHLSANNPYAAAARESYVSAAIGSGIMPAPQLDDAALKAEVVQLWNDWTDQADADWRTDFYGLQSICATEMFEAGEVFIRFRTRRPEDGLTVPLQLQVLPAEMLDTSLNRDLGNNRRIECGIEFDAIGRRSAYHFWTVFPGTDQYFGIPQGQYTAVPADEVLHLYRPIRAGQIRGVPHTLSAMTTLALLDLYDDAELERKRTAALFGAFIKRPAIEEEDHPLGVSQNLTTPSGEVQSSPALEPGITVDLAPGEDITFAEPADVGPNYEAFQYRMLLRAASGMEVTYSDMSGDLRHTSFGSIRAGLISYRRRIETIQFGVFAYQLCRPVYKRWWTEAVLAGALPVTADEFASNQRQYLRVNWTPPRWDWIDPLKDLEAEMLAVQNGFTSRSAVIKKTGMDPEEVDKQIAQDLERQNALGIGPFNAASPPRSSELVQNAGDGSPN